MSLDEIAGLFDLSRITKSPAIFDNAKLDWMNRNYINKTDSNALEALSVQYFIEAGLVPANAGSEIHAWLVQVIDLMKSHVDHLDQLPREAKVAYGFGTDSPEIDADAREALGKPEGKLVAQEFMRLVNEKESLTPESYREIVGQVKVNTKQKGRNLFHPIRAALTGRGSGPDLEKLIPIFEMGSRLSLPRKVMSCRERLQAILSVI
jgi:glutamyl/glutaminyl-tRNA synthetase